MVNHAAVWMLRISASRRAWACRGMDGSLRIDVNGAPLLSAAISTPCRRGTERDPAHDDSLPASVDPSLPGWGTVVLVAGRRRVGFRSACRGKSSSTSDPRSVGLDASSAPSPSAGGGRSAVPDGTHRGLRGTLPLRPSVPCGSSRRARPGPGAPAVTTIRIVRRPPPEKTPPEPPDRRRRSAAGARVEGRRPADEPRGGRLGFRRRRPAAVTGRPFASRWGDGRRTRAARVQGRRSSPPTS